MYYLFFVNRLNKEIVASGTLEDMVAAENELRKECRKIDPDGVEVDCFIRSDEELEDSRKAKERWDALTDEEKQTYIEVDGKKYVKALYEANLRNKK